MGLTHCKFSYILLFKYSSGFLSGMLGSPFGHMGLAGLAAGQFGAGMPGLGLPGMGYPYPSAQALAQVGVRMPGMVGPAGCVLLISGLNEVDTEPDHLFMLFGVYGDVLVSRFYALNLNIL